MQDFFYNENNSLMCDEVPLDEVVKQLGTPLYVYSSSIIEYNYKKLYGSLSLIKPLVAYSVKANSNISIIKKLSLLGAGADVVSLGELKRSIISGIPGNKIVFSGVGKQPEEISEALDAKILQFNVESVEELKLISQVAITKKLKAPIALRVNPNVNAGGHPKISTGKDTDKFGIPYTEAKKIYGMASELEGIKIVGIDMHIGSQIMDLEPFKNSFNKISSLINQLRDIGHNIINLDVGGGLGIPYTKEENSDLLFSGYIKMLIELKKKLNLKIILEPGRFLVGNAGILLTKILYKKLIDKKNFLIVDAGMNDFLRPALYSAKHRVDSLNIDKKDKEFMNFDIVGPICETADTIAENISLPKSINSGSYLFVRSVGAYGSVMSSNYNTRGLIAEAFIEGKKYEIIRKKQSIEDIIKNEKIASWL